MGIVGIWGCRQPLHKRLAIVSYPLLDCDEKVALLFETILEMLVADDLHGLHLHATPVCRLMSDGFGWRKVDRRHLTSEQLRRRSAGRGNAWILRRAD